MPERLKEIIEVPLLQEYVCDNCGEGTMVLDGNIAYLTQPTQYQHKCTKCGIVRTFTKQYPIVAYRYMEKPAPFEAPAAVDQPAIEGEVVPEGGEQ